MGWEGEPKGGGVGQKRQEKKGEEVNHHIHTVRNKNRGFKGGKGGIREKITEILEGIEGETSNLKKKKKRKSDQRREPQGGGLRKGKKKGRSKIWERRPQRQEDNRGMRKG